MSPVKRDIGAPFIGQWSGRDIDAIPGIGSAVIRSPFFCPEGIGTPA